jgi:hypothetical protein
MSDIIIRLVETEGGEIRRVLSSFSLPEEKITVPYGDGGYLKRKKELLRQNLEKLYKSREIS